MKKVKRVIVIEDNKNLLVTYEAILKMAGYQVDISENLDEALLKINSNTYHVALVDLQLVEHDEFDRAGVKIIKYFQELNEGTQTVVVSGQKTPEVFVEVLQELGVFEYILKKEITPEHITAAINNAYNKCNIRRFGAFDSITKFLSGGKNVVQWEHKYLSLFGIGAKDLYTFLNDLITPYAPLLPIKDSPVPMNFDVENQCLKGIFWSKAIGAPISIDIYSQKKLEEASSSEIDECIIQKIDKFNLSGIVYTLPEYVREMFADQL